MSSAPHFVDSLHSEGQFFEGLFRDYFPATFPFSHFVSRSTSSLSRFRLYGLDSPEGYDCVGDWPTDHKGGRCIQSHLCHFDLNKVTCVILIWKSHFFHFGLEQSPLCHFDLNKFSFVILFINKDGQSLIWLISKFFPLKSSPQRRLICRWRAKHPTKAPGTRWLWWLAWIARDLCSLQSCWGVSKESICKAKNAITMVPDWGLG